jgi:methylated-DNA-[protein]-cysteine S-methyltransferase
MHSFCYYNNHLVQLLLVKKEQHLHKIFFVQKNNVIQLPTDYVHAPKNFKEICKQLELYFTKKSKMFSMPFLLEGTAFEKKVWQELQKIPYGKTLSYGELARKIKTPNAARAVGTAARKNPLPILIPCHRLIGGNGNLVGFAGGLPIKMELLKLEGIKID